MIDFVCWVLLVALLVNFLRTLAIKWGILEYLQVNAPNEFFHKLFSCDFCQSFWLSLFICIFLAIFVKWYLIFVPFFACNIRW